MRGTIIHWDEAGQSGIITDADGLRHDFGMADFRGDGGVRSGCTVDFLLADGRATDIYILPDQVIAQAKSPEEEKASTYGIIAMVCGGVGFLLGPLALAGGIPAIIFGIKGRRLGRDLANETPRLFSLIGLILGIAVTTLSVLFIFFFVGMFSLISMMPPPPHR